MISSVSDYLFVTGADIDTDHPHGDLDRIIIDGGVMPLRTGTSATTGVANSKILRGEDVAFLQEAACERCIVAGVSYNAATFSRKVGAMNYSYIRHNLVVAAPGFVSSVPTTHVVTDPTEWDDPFVAARRSAADITGVAVSRGDALSQSNVLSFFDDLKKFTIFAPTTSTSYSQYQTPTAEVLTSLCPQYPMTASVGSYGVVIWRDSGGEHKTVGGIEYSNAYGGNARTYGGFTASARTFPFPVSYSWYMMLICSQSNNGTVTESDVYLDLGLTTSTINVTNAQMLQYGTTAIGMVGFPWTPGTAETTEGASHLTQVIWGQPFCVITLGDHTKWW